jgi:hypothetical protein
MPLQLSRTLPLNRPDHVANELAIVLTANSWCDFQSIFNGVHSNLKVRHGTKENTERLRLRTYEKLQIMVNRGMVKKQRAENGIQYRATERLAEQAD